jgi:hypothetical protein
VPGGQHHSRRGQRTATAHGEPHHPREPALRRKVPADDLAERLRAVPGPGRYLADGQHRGDEAEQEKGSHFTDHMDI